MANAISFLIGVLSSIAAYLIVDRVGHRFASRFPFRRVVGSVRILLQKLQGDGFVPDYVIGINRNGAIVASILAGYLGVRPILAVGFETERREDGGREAVLSKIHLASMTSLSRRKVLVVACFVDTGLGLAAVVNYLRSIPDPPEVRTAAVFTNPTPLMKPRYFVFEIGKNLHRSINQLISQMPWMGRGWRQLLERERSGRG